MKAVEKAEQRAWYPLVLILALVALGIFAAGIFSYRNYARHFRTGIEEQLAAITELKVAQIVQWRSHRLADADYLRRTPEAARRALDILAQPASLTSRPMFTSWLEFLFAGGSYEQALLLDERLNVGLVYPEGASGVLGEAARRAAQEALRSQQVVVADLHREAEGGPVYLSLMVPLVVRRESTGDKVPAAGKGSSPADRSEALLVLQINAENELNPMIQLWPTASRTAETLLVRRDGHDALFLNELKFQTNAALRLRISLASTNVPAVKAALGQEGIVEGIDYRGEPVLACLRAIPDSPWSMVTRMDLAEVYAPLRERLWLTVLLMAVLLLGAGVGVGLVWREQRVQFYGERVEGANEARRMATVVRDSNDAITIQDFAGRITAWNRGAELMYGYSEEEALVANIDRLTAPDKVVEQKDFIRRLEAGEAVTSLETQRVTKDGRILDVWMTVTKLVDEAGKPIGIASTERDITARKRAAEEASRMVTVVRDSNDAITIQDFAGRITAWNRGAELMYGYSEAEALVANIDLLTAPGKVVEQKDFIRRLEAGEAVTSLETQRVTKDGRILDVWMTVTKLVDEAGKPIGLASTERDITERKLKEQAMGKSEARYRALFNTLIDGFCIIEVLLDPEGRPADYRFLEVNPEFEAQTGLRNAQGKRMRELAPEHEEYWFEIYGKVALTGEPARFVHEATALNRWYDVSAYRVGEQDSRQVAILFNDITERKRAEENIRRMATVVRDSNDAITIQDFEGRITAWNRGAELMYGYSEAEALAMNIDRLTAPGKVDEQKDFIRRLMVGEAITSFETQRVTKGGCVLDVWMTVSKLMHDTGQPIGIASTERDITLRKRAVEEVHRLNVELEQRVVERTAQLEAANKELEAFSYSVSHDLRAPLRHVQDYVDMLGREAGGQLSDKGRRYMKTIADASREMGVLIDDLLAFSHMGRADMIETTVNLDSLVQTALRDLEPATRERNIVWKIPPLPAVQADPAMLKLVLTNLLSNAVKFTGPRDPAQIEIGCDGMEGERVIVFVRDNGVGFDPQYAHKLFGVFQRLHRADEFEGTGIGLANVRRIIARQGGRVWAEGALDRGATFYITLKPAASTNPAN